MENCILKGENIMCKVFFVAAPEEAKAHPGYPTQKMQDGTYVLTEFCPFRTVPTKCSVVDPKFQLNLVPKPEPDDGGSNEPQPSPLPKSKP